MVDGAVPEDWLRILRRYAEQGRMTADRRSRLDALLELAARHRPTVAWLLEH